MPSTPYPNADGRVVLAAETTCYSAWALALSPSCCLATLATNPHPQPTLPTRTHEGNQFAGPASHPSNSQPIQPGIHEGRLPGARGPLDCSEPLRFAYSCNGTGWAFMFHHEPQEQMAEKLMQQGALSSSEDHNTSLGKNAIILSREAIVQHVGRRWHQADCSRKELSTQDKYVCGLICLPSAMVSFCYRRTFIDEDPCKGKYRHDGHMILSMFECFFKRFWPLPKAPAVPQPRPRSWTEPAGAMFPSGKQFIGFNCVQACFHWLASVRSGC